MANEGPAQPDEPSLPRERVHSNSNLVSPQTSAADSSSHVEAPQQQFEEMKASEIQLRQHNEPSLAT